eukprot:784668-Pelagomonas_calceolata.AAC.1
MAIQGGPDQDDERTRNRPGPAKEKELGIGTTWDPKPPKELGWMQKSWDGCQKTQQERGNMD